jgi:hypothetical protein
VRVRAWLKYYGPMHLHKQTPRQAAEQGMRVDCSHESIARSLQLHARKIFPQHHDSSAALSSGMDERSNSASARQPTKARVCRVKIWVLGVRTRHVASQSKTATADWV